MKAIIELELRNDNSVQLCKLASRRCDAVAQGLGKAIIGSWPASAWCAEITGTDPKWKYKREFCRFKKDYSRANSKGSRGVYAIYCLDGDKYYEVKDGSRRYFAQVLDWKVVEVDKEEVDEWLKSKSESTSSVLPASV